MLADALPALDVDAVQIQRALVNVIDNALKFSSDEVVLGATVGDDVVFVDVLDRGRGIDADGGTLAGLGLGLEIARGFVAVNDGRLTLEPREHGGTRARFALPARRLPVVVASVKSRVLVVDDEPQFLRALTTNLRGAGYEVETATTAAEALAAAGLRPPDAIVLDLLLPDGSGTEVCRELRTWSEAPIILVSARRRRSREDRCARRRSRRLRDEAVLGGRAPRAASGSAATRRNAWASRS